MYLISRPSEQLKTTHCFATHLARSLTVSVLPVPAGPAGADRQKKGGQSQICNKKGEMNTIAGYLHRDEAEERTSMSCSNVPSVE